MRRGLSHTLEFQFCFWMCRLISPILSTTYRELDSSDQGWWCSSMTSTLHAVLVVYLVICALLTTAEFTSADSDLHFTTPESTFIIEIFWGYLISDLLCVLYYNKRWHGWLPTLVHHICGAFTMGFFLNHGYSHTLSLICILVEFTTPFVNLRWFLDKLGMKGSSLYFWNGLAMTLSWFVVRVLGFMWLGTLLWSARAQIRELPTKQAVVMLVSYVVGYSLQVRMLSYIRLISPADWSCCFLLFLHVTCTRIQIFVSHACSYSGSRRSWRARSRCCAVAVVAVWRRSKWQQIEFWRLLRM